jgi:type I restriction enzyme S subunit
VKTYPAYKDSGIEWIGEIPKHWIKLRLKFTDEVIMGQSPNSEDYNDIEAGLPFLQGNADFTNLYPKPRIWCETATKVANKNDVLLSVRAPVGAVNMADREYGIGRGLCAIRFKKSFHKYLYYLSLSINDELNSIATGSTYTAVTADEVKNVFIPLLPSDEQKAIADFLDKKTALIDGLIEKKKRQIELLKEQRQAVINQAVTKGLNPNVEMKDSGIEWIGQIPKHWEVKRLKFLGKAILGLTYSPDDIVEDETKGMLVLRSSNIQNSKLSLEDNVYVDTKVPEELITQEGDILICSRNGSRQLIGKNLCIDDRSKQCTFGAFMTIFRSEHWRYLSKVFNSTIFTSQSGMYLTSTINQLTVNTLNGLIIAIPPTPEEQEEVAIYIDEKTEDIDKGISKAEKQIELLQEYRIVLISEAVTGKIDVREAV